MFNITTICHKTSDTHHPLLLLTSREGQRYLIGKLGEGSQRSLNDSKVKLGKLRAIFMTGTLSTWDQIGGLPGLFLTISDATKNSIDLYCNSSGIVNYIVATWRYFVFRKGVELKVQDVENGQIIADSTVVINPIKVASIKKGDHVNDTSYFQGLKKLVSLMFPLDTSKVNDPDPESYKSDPADNDIHSHVSIAHLPIQEQIQDSLCYVIRFLPLRGKFDVSKAKELNIKPGKDYALLTQGQSVISSTGDTVNPDQVMGPPIPFKKVVVLDIPNNDYLQNTVENDKWYAKDEEEFGTEDVGLVYHFLGDDIVFDSPQYTDFVQKFPGDCTHIISHSKLSNNTLTFKTFSAELLKLRAIKKGHFNLPYSEPYDGLANQKLHNMQQFIIAPTGISFDDSLIHKSSWSEIYDEHVAPLNLSAAKSEVIDDIPLPLGLISPGLKDNIQVSTLGTGSALPSIYRNVISNLVRIPFKNSATGEVEFKGVLFDSGENTLGSLLRTFGRDEQYTSILSELRLIYLSHLHADHHLGMVSIINKWMEVNIDNDHTLHLVVPWQYDHFINEWCKFDNSADLSRINYISCEEFVRNRLPEYQRMSFNEFEDLYDEGSTKIDIARDSIKPLNKEAHQKLQDDLGIIDFQNVRAIHCFWAYSVSITFQLDENQTFKVSYSGDTRPNTRFVDIGYGSDLLIHEASLDNELIEEAISKKHTTVIEALNVARYMNCKKLILTHFSTRSCAAADYITTTQDFDKATNTLKRYIQEYGSSRNTNVFELDKYEAEVKSFDDLEVIFAFDSLIVRLNDTHSQKENLGLMNQINAVADVESIERKRKETERLKVKQEAKRTKRLARKGSP